MMLYTLLRRIFPAKPIPPVRTPFTDARLDAEIWRQEARQMNDEMCLPWDVPYWDEDGEGGVPIVRQGDTGKG